MKILAENRVARHEYFIDDTYEAGISLDGGEVKSVRAGSVNLRDSFCVIKNAEVFIKNMHVAVYDKSGAFNTSDSKRDRRLLLHKSEIRRLIGKVNEKGYTLVPLKIYLKQSLIKVEVGLCKGKHTYDKKPSIKERDLDRSARKDVKNYGI
ncbi:MAG: SsrA-binding protein SmpB [Christensenellaceae bacterium]|nr:SsrA-binding protein SmpB [Christensenellaceae bacterium]